MQLKCHVPLADRVVPESRQLRYHGVRAVTLAARARLCLQPRPSAASGPQVLSARGSMSRDPSRAQPPVGFAPAGDGPEGTWTQTQPVRVVWPCAGGRAGGGRRGARASWLLTAARSASAPLGGPTVALRLPPCVHLFHWQTGRLRAESRSSVFLLMRHLLEQCFSVITKDAEELSFWVHSISW